MKFFRAQSIQTPVLDVNCILNSKDLPPKSVLELAATFWANQNLVGHLATHLGDEGCVRTREKH